jgi:predicted metal-dependent HD superfamily phosphohydrolase
MNFDVESWSRLWQRIGLRGAAKASFEEVTRRYNEPHRYYHNSRHIAECLAHFEAVRSQASEVESLETAIWLHDVVYHPKRADNEKASSRFAAELLVEGDAASGLVSATVALIDATTHKRLPSDAASALIIDIDLSIFGASDDRFWEYERQIRSEYDFVPKAIYRVKRAEILEQFLGRPSIYHTEYFRSRYEQAARSHLVESIHRLRRRFSLTR